MPKPRIQLTLAVTVGLGTLLALAGCGSNAPAIGSGSGLASSSSGGASTVSVRTVDGQSALVNQTGVTLYSNDQDSNAKPSCVSSDCTAIWAPLTVPANSKPTAGSGVPGTLGTIARPDGSQQVTLNGKPLYTFSFDHGAGKVTGNNAHDDFGGMSFTWHNALSVAKGAAPAAPATSAGSGNYGGY
jgi:predicted lipoprotein with Yx(FWY)xxD motif